MSNDLAKQAGVFGRVIHHVTPGTLKDGPNTPGQSRKTAYSNDGLWIGQCEVTARDVPSQWHHHKNYDSIMYMLEGRIRVDWGARGEKSFEIGPGEYGFFGRRVIHRAQIIDAPENCRYVFFRIGEGESVANVEGPGFAPEDQPEVTRNEFQQPIGEDIPDWRGAKTPGNISLSGAHCTLEPVSKESHLTDLFEAFAEDKTGQMWTYMPVGPFGELDQLGEWMDWACASNDPLFRVICDKETGKAAGFASFMRIKPAPGVIEVGYIAFSPRLQKTPIATEAMYLMMKYAFEDLGYRRYEWKCDNLNEPSHNAAKRLGFTYDGLFRQALVYKGRNRDTAWYSVLDSDWPRLKNGFETWLSPDNFDDRGQQKKSLSDLTPIRSGAN